MSYGRRPPAPEPRRRVEWSPFGHPVTVEVPEDDYAYLRGDWTGFDRQMYALLSWGAKRALTRKLEVMDEFRRAAVGPARATWRPSSEWYERQPSGVVDSYSFGRWW